MKKIAALLLLLSAPCLAQFTGDPAATMAAQRDALARFAAMDGVWRGPATSLLPGGEKRTVTQTERIGPFLGGTVKMIEGRGYGDDGEVRFNALGIISYDTAKKAFTMRSYAQGHMGDFPIEPVDGGGYQWSIPAGPATLHYSATIRDGVLTEVGDRVVPGREPVRFFEMKLRRVGDTEWPTMTPVPAR